MIFWYSTIHNNIKISKWISYIDILQSMIISKYHDNIKISKLIWYFDTLQSMITFRNDDIPQSRTLVDIPLRWTPHRMHWTRRPSWQVETWRIVPFMLFFFTVSNVQAPFVQLEALVNRINDDKSMIMQCVYNPPSWNMDTEGNVGAWDLSIKKYAGWFAMNISRL